MVERKSGDELYCTKLFGFVQDMSEEHWMILIYWYSSTSEHPNSQQDLLMIEQNLWP